MIFKTLKLLQVSRVEVEDGPPSPSPYVLHVASCFLRILCSWYLNGSLVCLILCKTRSSKWRQAWKGLIFRSDLTCSHLTHTRSTWHHHVGHFTLTDALSLRVCPGSEHLLSGARFQVVSPNRVRGGFERCSQVLLIHCSVLTYAQGKVCFMTFYSRPVQSLPYSHIGWGSYLCYLPNTFPLVGEYSLCTSPTRACRFLAQSRLHENIFIWKKHSAEMPRGVGAKGLAS